MAPKDPRFNRPSQQPLTAEHALAIAMAGVWIGISADEQAVIRVRKVIGELHALGYQITKIPARP